MIDISYELDQTFPIYPKNPPYSLIRIADLSQGDSCNLSLLQMGSHTGTHIDAPFHFIEKGKDISELPLERMNGIAKVIQIQNEKEITVEELKTYSIQKQDILLFKTKNSEQFQGKNLLEDYVTLNYQAADYLVEKAIKLVGLDYMTIERPRTSRVPGKSIHTTLLEKEILIVETLKLDHVFPGTYYFSCFPLKIKNCDGSPVRAVLSRL